MLRKESEKQNPADEQAVEALRTNEERLRLALEVGNMAVWEWVISTGEVGLPRFYGPVLVTELVVCGCAATNAAGV